MQQKVTEPRLKTAGFAAKESNGTAVSRVAMIAPGLDILGGQGVQAQALKNGLENEGIQVNFIAINPRFPTWLSWLRRIRFARTLLNQLLYVGALSRLRNADVLHLFSASYWSFQLAQVPAIFAARCLGVPVILNYHSGEADDHLSRWGSSLHYWLSRVDLIVVPSEYLQQVFMRHGYEATVIPNVIDLKSFPFRRRTTFRPRLISTRNLETLYRIEHTLEAFARIQAMYPDATLVVAGYGTQEKKLRRWVQQHQLSGVNFVGRVEPEDMPALLDEADIFLNSSAIDNQPVSILEAFAMGLPVVSTPTGDIPYLVRLHETGLLVPHDDPDAMAQAVHWILENPSTASALVDAAFRSLSRFTWPNVRQAWIRLYAVEVS